MSSGPTAPPRRAPASHGFGWLAQSVALLRLQAVRLLLIGLLMQLILGLSQLPLVGLLIILSVPSLTAGLLEAFHVTALGGRPEVRLLFKPLTTKGAGGRLFLMGALVFAVGVVTISLLLSGSEGNFDPAVLERIEQGDLDAIASLNQETLARMGLALLIGLAVSGTLSYFTIPLIWFGNAGLGTALATGMRALLVNWQPFLVLAIGLVIVAVPLGLLVFFLASMSGSAGGLSVLLMGLVMLLLMLFQLLLFGAQYCSYRDIFGIEEPQEEAPPPDDDGQLLA